MMTSRLLNRFPRFQDDYLRPRDLLHEPYKLFRGAGQNGKGPVMSTLLFYWMMGIDTRFNKPWKVFILNQTFGILMNVTAIIGVKLPPGILAETLKMIDPIVDFHISDRLRDASAIEPLLVVVEMEDVPWERQAFGAMIAAELCLKHHGERMKVLKVLRKLSICVRVPEAKAPVAGGDGFG